MPELPEVQTIVDDLNKKIKGDTIVGFWSDWKKAIKHPVYAKFARDIKNRKISRARRIGKNIFIDLSGGKSLYIHLKMTGHLLVKNQETVNSEQKRVANKLIPKKLKSYFNDRVNQYIHHIFYLKSKILNTKYKIPDTTLEFSDLRKFGKIVLDDTEKINNLPEIKKLGVDAMSADFTLNKFQEILNKKNNKPIGLLLMEQELIAGIGNIYRSEILFEAGILPERKIASLSPEEIKNIYQNIKKVLKHAIKLRGTSDSDYRDTSGAPGGFQKVLKVYNKENAKCQKCGRIIKRLKLGQRSAFYCAFCQK